METRPAAIRLLKELRTLNWFANSGGPLAAPMPPWVPVTRVDSWDEAVRVMRSTDTGHFLTDSQNELHRERSAAMGDLKAQAKATRAFNTRADSMGDEYVRTAALACASLPSKVRDVYESKLRWMIVKAVVIAQYDEVIVENRLYWHILGLFRAGHCVCGWDGEYPDDSLVVY